MEDLDVRSLYWGSRNFRHIRKHGGRASTVDEVLANAPRYFRNTPGHKGSHVMIGPSANGRFWTVAIAGGRDGQWMPVTARPSTRQEIQRYMEG